MYAPFQKAIPVWADGLQDERLITLGLHTTLTAGNYTLRIACAGFYRLFVNDVFTYYGPARCAEGFYRVDELPLTLPDGEVHIAIETVNYRLNSFGCISAPAFIQAEFEKDGEIVLATGDTALECFMLTERVRRVQRYSYQRPAAESYILAPDYAAWRMGKPCANAVAVKVTKTEDKVFVPRRIPHNTFPDIAAETLVAVGTFVDGVKPAEYFKDRSLTMPNDPATSPIQGYAEAELEQHLSDLVQEFSTTSLVAKNAPYSGNKLAAGEFALIALPGAKTGFITADIRCKQAGVLYILFDETLTEDGDVDPNARECCNVIRLEMETGDYAFKAMEPFGFKYAKLVVTDGAFAVDNFRLTALVCPQPVTTTYQGNDPEVAAVFDAAKESFIQNSSDLFMDCPTRERAGWLCDSFFTARAEYEFTGKNIIEYNYLENYLLPEKFKNMPHGMVPMCYPSDHRNGSFIPNWAMWLVVELEDRLHRVGDREFILSFRKRVYDLIDWCKQYENADGLLEKLPGWIFVEWSKANDLVQDINFPTNMMYARMLVAAANIFDDEQLRAKAEALKKLIRARSFDGTFFVDNEVYEGDTPVSTGERTEACQYYAFFTGVATPETYPELWKKLVEDFGPDREKTGKHPEIYPANAFIGNYLRLMLLEENGLYAQMLSEIKGYFYYMAQRTGTLWEHISTQASCIHGFASYAVHFILVAEQHMKG